MRSDHVQAARPKHPCKRSFQRRDLISELPMQRQRGLLGKQGAEREQLECAFERIELLRTDMPEQRVPLRICPEIEMPDEARERGCCVLRRAVSGAANVEELPFPVTDAPCVKPEAAFENGAGERRAMQVHARRKLLTTGSRLLPAIRVPFQMLKMSRFMRAYSLAAFDAAKVRAYVSGVS